ncbi:L,D-transpeptidase family protein [Phenylobacterium sp. J426]|nr:L,D-transpeptidase family protein [Phenylobacterium sp. J426]MCR5876282.1 L,D-transpeptidase family protein [Phenylobacterium sp. J426]
MIEANLVRAQALPADFGDRFIVVDVAAGQLWFYDAGREVTTMKVVTGKPEQPTPIMAGMARHLIFNPYWNVPEDLVQTSIAPKVLAQGLGYIEAEGLEVLSDYSEDAVVLDPAQVDWKAVRAGSVSVRVRQRPGPKNMMGKVKLMLPNPLGIYLHDTPHKGDFAKSQRLASSGCVRLEDAMKLARELVGEEVAETAVSEGGEERRVDLGEPVPVFITYFTAMPTDEGFVFRPDVYGRDAAWEARQAARGHTIAAAPWRRRPQGLAGHQLQLVSIQRVMDPSPPAAPLLHHASRERPLKGGPGADRAGEQGRRHHGIGGSHRTGARRVQGRPAGGTRSAHFGDKLAAAQPDPAADRRRDGEIAIRRTGAGAAGLDGQCGVPEPVRRKPHEVAPRRRGVALRVRSLDGPGQHGHANAQSEPCPSHLAPHVPVARRADESWRVNYFRRLYYPNSRIPPKYYPKSRSVNGDVDAVPSFMMPDATFHASKVYWMLTKSLNLADVICGHARHG